MVDFIEANEEELSEFEQYYLSDIVPAVDDVNCIKDKYRSKFWGYFWTILFLMCANTLFCFFSHLLYNRPISYEQIFLVNAVAAVVVFFPVYQYYRAPKTDIFDIFLNFYGNWKHLKDMEESAVNSPIIPPHDFAGASHNVDAEYPDLSLNMCDMNYKVACAIKNIHYKRKVSSGILLSIKLKVNFSGRIYLFDKKGFYRKNKFPEMLNAKDVVAAPLAECFHIFTDNTNYALNMLPTMFFERILDMKDTFGAKHLYVEIQGDTLRIYFEGAHLYIESNGLWSRKINKEKFVQLNDGIEQILIFIEALQTLQEQYDRH